MSGTRLLVFLSLFSVQGCAPKKPPKSHSQPPAAVHQVSNELELATVTLTPQAEKRLGIAVQPVKRTGVASQRPYPAVVVVPPQSQTSLLAPVAGTVRYEGPTPLAIGTAVRQGQTLFRFEPLVVEQYALSPTQRESLRASRLTMQQNVAAIQTRINNAKVEVEAARVDLHRAEQLYAEKVGSRKRVDDARARAQLARETLDSARRELQTVQHFTAQPVPDASRPEPLTQVAPIDGTVLKIQVASGQVVSVGQPLLDLIDLRRLWLRVRMPQAEVTEIVRTQAALVTFAGRTLRARPVQGPPTADPLSASVDLYYALEMAGTAVVLNPDQRLEVSLPLTGSGTHLTVPRAAILYDVYGGTWVYVREKQDRAYQRVRVVLEFSTADGVAVLSQGPPPGTAVVTQGAAELFGIEFGND